MIQKGFVLFATLLFPILVWAGDVYYPPGSDQVGSPLPNWDPVCRNYMDTKHDGKPIGKVTLDKEKNIFTLTFSDPKELAVIKYRSTDVLEDPIEAYEEEKARGHEPIGAIVKFLGVDWYAIITAKVVNDDGMAIMCGPTYIKPR